VLVLEGEPPETLQGNVVLDQLAGATSVWTGDAAPQVVQGEVERLAQQVQDGGGVPHVIPFGGPTPTPRTVMWTAASSW
jgi:D-cysteine desulfhydrase